MSSAPVTIDPSTIKPIDPPSPAANLQSAVSYASQQNPDQYAKLLKFQQLTGVPPVVSKGNEDQVKQAADAGTIDPHYLTTIAPRISGWASNPDNAAVSGVDEIHSLAGVEQNAAAMRGPTDQGSLWSAIKDAVTHPLETLVGADTPAVEAQKQASIASVAQQTGNPFLSSVVQAQQAAAKPLLSVTSTAPFKRIFDPKSQNVFSRAMTGGAKSVEALSAPSNLELLAALPFAPEDAGALISGVFSAQMGEGAATGGYETLRAAYNGDYGDAAERGAGALISAAFAAGAGKHALAENLTSELAPRQTTTSPYLDNLTQAVDAAGESKLRVRAPEKYLEAQQVNFSGDQSLRIPSDQFASYFNDKGMDPAQVASGLGSTNYAEAVISGGDVEVPPASFLSSLDPEHQKALLPDIVDPASGLTARQHQEAMDQFAANGGEDQLAADTQAADEETATSPEYQEVKEQLRQNYVDAGETPEVAETLATKDANVYSNLARNAGMKPNELLSLYHPKVVTGDLPSGETLHQEAIDKIHTVIEAAKQPGHAPQKAIIAPVDSWLVQAAKENGHDIEGYQHVIDGSAIRHVIKEHGNADTESKRGNVAITEADFDKVPSVLAEPDRVIFGTKNRIGRDQIGYTKKMSDGSTLYIEEVRTGKKELAAVSMRKFPATMDADRVAASLHLDARDDGIEPIVVEHPSAGKGDETLLQSAPEGQPRGWFRALPDGSFEIGKTKIGDLSTFVHEPAHAYLKIIGDLSKRDGASDILKGDYQKVLDFLGAKDGESLTTEQQEKWARANEQYLREGKAPSPGLKGTFQRFAIWLGSVYKKASDLGVDLSDEIRGVFDRLYAAEDGVNRAEAEAGPKLFASAEEAGWNDVQFKAYAEMNNVSIDQAKSQLLGMMNDAAVREKTELWRQEEKNVREAVTAEIDQSPGYAAIRALRKGKLDDGTDLSLSKDDLVKQFGEDRVKELQKRHPGMYRNEGGIDPETVAEILGFDSAETMMRSFETAPRRSAAIEQATREYMTAKHGDIRYDGTLNDQARLALENDKRSEGLYTELKALKKKLADAKDKATGQKDAMRSIEIAPMASYREAAHQMVESKAVADLQPTRYLDASRKYSREAFDALRRGDTDAAAQAKHKELMNHFLFREASAAKEYVGKFESYVKRVTSKGIQSKLGLAGSDYRDQFNRILGRYGLGPSVATDRTLGEWASQQFDEGKEPAIDPSILNEGRTVNYRNASVSEIRSVHDALVNVRKLASLELGIEVNGRKIDFDAATANMSARARESLESKPTRVLKGNATTGERISDLVQRGDALLMRTERLMEWMDGGKSGPWHDNLWNLAADAQGREYAMQESVTKQLGNALENMPKEQREKMLDKVTVPGIPETVTRHDLVSMAFNMGNDGNLDRLQKTFIAHGWDPSAIEQVKGMLTREEWQFVQGAWDSLKPLGQAQADLEKRLTGLPPVMVEPTPLHLKLADGSEMSLDGGYYPVVMDPRFSKQGALQDSGTTAQNLMESGYGRATTSRGNMKERTGFGGPLQLDYEQVLTQHTAKVIKDITHREFMLAANKLLTDDSIRTTMRETLGQGYEEKMMPWLRSIINDRNGSAVQGLGDFSRLMGKLRTNLTLATLSYKASTSLLQWSHVPRMLLSTNPGSYAQAMVDFLAHPLDMTEQIRELSPNEMAHRGENLNRDVRAVLAGSPGIQRSVAQIGNVSIKYTDHMLSFPLWLSVYRDALKKNVDMTEDEAQYQAMHEADSAVRLGLGAGSPKDLPPIMRSSDLSKLLTMFYSFHNGIYGQLRDIAHQTNGIKDAPKLTYGLALSTLIPAVVGSIVTGRGPKDGEDKGLWAAKKSLLFAMGTIPLLRDAASAMEGDGDVKLTPLVSVMSKGTKASMKAMEDKPDKDWTGIGLDYLEVGGDLSGVPGTAQLMKPIRYAHRAQQGKIDDPNAFDAFVGSPRK